MIPLRPGASPKNCLSRSRAGTFFIRWERDRDLYETGFLPAVLSEFYPPPVKTERGFCENPVMLFRRIRSRAPGSL